MAPAAPNIDRSKSEAALPVWAGVSLGALLLVSLLLRLPPAAFTPPASLPRVVTGHPGATDAEVAAAVAVLSIEPAAPGAG